MATFKRGWIKKVIDGVSTKVFPITHVKSIYYNYTQNKTLADKLNDIDTEIESTKNKVGEMVERNGGKFFTNLSDVANYLNGKPSFASTINLRNSQKFNI